MSPRAKDPKALRRGPRFLLCLPAAELDAAKADAEARGVSLAAHIRDLLEAWRRKRRR